MSTKRAATRQRIVNAASQGFRSQGFAGVGVDGIAKAAGVTSGAFYSHLGSKNGAFEAALEIGLDEVIAAVPVFQQQNGVHWVEEFVDYYFGKAHREDLAGGCAMTTLSPEVVRAGPEIHELYEVKMKKIVDLMIKGLAGGTNEEKRQRAWAVIGGLIGGLTMCRAVQGTKTIQQITKSLKKSVVQAAGETE